MIRSGDASLEDHLAHTPKNATYISKTTQNDVLDCIRVYIQQKIVKDIQQQAAGPLYSLSADEVTDVSNWEQLGLVVRYLESREKPVERLMAFNQCAITGEALLKTVLQCLEELGLDPKNCRF